MPGLRPDDGDPVNRALNDIFTDYVSKSAGLAGRYDRDVRDPTPILDKARHLGLIPDRNRLLTVTGSKGKGSVARSAAAVLEAVAPLATSAFSDPSTEGSQNHKVGLIVSPNEVWQTDRLRIDGKPIGRDDFLNSFDSIRPHLDDIRRKLTPPHYLSPFGAFLLIGLHWFRNSGVDWVVLEGGRGAAHDEVGRLPAAVSVITTIEAEHLSQLGPALSDIARDKTSIARQSDICLLGPVVPQVLDRTGVGRPANAIAFDDAWLRGADRSLPHWLCVDHALGRQAARRLMLANDLSPMADNRNLAALAGGSFGAGKLTFDPAERGDLALVFDATGRPEALDRTWYSHAIAKWRSPIAILCLSDQKDPDGVADALAAMGLPFSFVTLKDAGMHSFSAMSDRYARKVIAALDYDDHEALAGLLKHTALSGGHDAIFCIGIQPYIRLVRRIVR